MYSNKGFSAIEMMVSLAIMSIVAGMGFVNYTEQIPRYELREAGRDITAQLRLLRQMAITEGATREIFFADGAYEFEVGEDEEQEQDLPSHVRFGVMEGVDENTYGGEGLPTNDGISFLGNSVSFQSDGLPEGSGAVYLTNAPFRNEAIAITVSITGRVKLFEWDGSEWE